MKNIRIYIAGHRGMVGSSIVRKLKKQKNIKIITRDKKDLDLVNQGAVQKFFKEQKIDQVYLAAAKVGGIFANNSYPAEFIYENLMIECNIIHSAFSNGVKKLLFLGSSCIYPKKTKQPAQEEALLTGLLEPTNEPYAIAKIAGIKLCESFNRQFGTSFGIDYRCLMPTNLYGPGDNYHPKNSHVIPALLRRFHEAKIKNYPKVNIWGTGKPKREFLYVDDLACAAIHLNNIDIKTYDKFTKPMLRHINVGSGISINIKQLAKMIKKVVGYKGKINFDTSKPDGSMSKLISSKRINRTGWKAKVNLEEGLIKTYKDFLK